ncbi:MAG: hypothetical protein WC789_10570 [Lentisphaeria bacterium]
MRCALLLVPLLVACLSAKREHMVIGDATPDAGHDGEVAGTGGDDDEPDPGTPPAPESGADLTPEPSAEPEPEPTPDAADGPIAADSPEPDVGGLDEPIDGHEEEGTPDLCSNGDKNPGETDVDCGGAKCPPCPNDKYCLDDSDCLSLDCRYGACKGAA